MFPQVLNAVLLSEGEGSNLLEIICLMSFTARLQKSLQKSALFGRLNSSLNQISCADRSRNIKLTVREDIRDTLTSLSSKWKYLLVNLKKNQNF